MSMPAIVPAAVPPMRAPHLTFPARALRAVCAATGIVLLAACGGGGGGDGATAGAGTAPVAAERYYASGVLSGLGALRVNGVSYDDSQATVVDADGNAATRDALALGMVVEVLATAASSSTANASATVVRYRSEVEGPVATIAGNTLVVLGQTVVVDDATVFEDGLLATITVGQVLEVHGPRDAAGRILASRIEVEDDLDDPFQLRGVASAIDTVARTFRIGDATVAYGGLGTAAQALVTDGATLRVQLQRTPDGTGAWIASALRMDTPLSDTGSSGSGSSGTAAGPRAELEGAITRMDSSTRFVVDGIVVDAGAVPRLPAGLAVGTLVEVSGRLVAGVLQATEVELEDRLGADAGFEIEGRITSLGTGSFVVRGVTVDYSGARFVGGTAARLAAGVEVEVQAVLAADGSTLVASVVEFDD